MFQRSLSGYPLPLITALVAMLLGYLVHPGWYGDGLWYAEDIAERRIEAEFGHLLWRPLGALTYQLFSPHLDFFTPLLALQSISLLCSSVVIALLVVCARELGGSLRSIWLLSVLALFSHFHLAYGFSGSSYPASSACLVASLFFLLRRRPHWAAFFLALSGGFWALALLAAPGLFVAYLLLYNRSAPAALLWSFETLLFFVLLLIAFFLLLPPEVGLTEWVKSSSHGISTDFGLLSVARAAAGFNAYLFYSGETQTALKLLLLGEYSIARKELLTHGTFFYLLGALLLFICVCASLATAWAILLKKGQATGHRADLSIVLIAGAALLGNLGFAVLWQGSDVERFTPAFPFLLLAIFCIRGQSEILRQWLVITCVVGNTLAILIGPVVDGTKNHRWLEQGLGHSLIGADVVILHGQDLGAKVWAPLVYFRRVEAFHLLFEAQQMGSDAVYSALRTRIEDAQRRGASVVFIDSLLAPDPYHYPDPMSPAPLFSSAEYPTLELAEIGEYLSSKLVQCKQAEECSVTSQEVLGYHFWILRRAPS